MASNYGYGLTDNSPNTPWNEPIIPERDFDLTISQSLSKDVTVCTNQYNPEYDEEYGQTFANTEDTDWNKVFKENDYHTPLQLIQLLGEVLQKDLEHGIVFKNPRFTQELINECQGWTEDETEMVEN